MTFSRNGSPLREKKAVLVGLVSSVPLRDHETTSAAFVQETSVVVGRLAGDVTLERRRREAGEYSDAKAMAVMTQDAMEYTYSAYCESKHEELNSMMNFGSEYGAVDICNKFGKMITDNNPMPSPMTLDTSKDITPEDLKELIRESQQLNFTLTGLVSKSMDTAVLAGACMEFPGSHDPCMMVCDHVRKPLGEMLCHTSSQVLPRLRRFLQIAHKQVSVEETDKPFMELVIVPETFKNNLSHLGYANIGYLYYAHSQLITNKEVFEKLAEQ